MKRYCRTTLAAIVTAMTLSINVLAAPVYHDVPESHWAHTYISAVTDRGLMVGDTSANFRPNDLMDKFETSRILARSAGFKHENVSAEERASYDSYHEKHRSFLSQFSTRFSRWNTSTDREIAFLLERQILTQSDLNQFVIIVDEREQLRALSRGEAAMFITRLMGMEQEALQGEYEHSFNDDANISASVRPYVYFLRSRGVVGGDENGNFNPNSGISRAAMAVMLARSLNLIVTPPTQASPIPSPVPSPTPGSDAGVSQVSAISGTVDVFYPSLNAIQIVAPSGDREIYRLAVGATVHVDGQLRAGAELRQGMPFSAVINNGAIVSIQATSVAENVAPEPAPPLQYIQIDGLVSSTAVNGEERTISIELRTINPRDNSVVTEIRTYTLSPSCTITHGSEDMEFSDILRGDIVTARVSGDVVYALELEERILVLENATLEQRRSDPTTGLVTFVVSAENDRRYELRVSADTDITRTGQGSVTWDLVRVGDSIDLKAEYGVLKELTASGTSSVVEGRINEINIGATQSFIYLRDSYGSVVRYYIISSSTDVYSLRVGDRVRLRLDSREISTVTLLDRPAASTVTGIVDSIRSGRLTLTDVQPSGAASSLVLDADTVIIDASTGEIASQRAISRGQRVYVVLRSANSDQVRTVTILE